MIDNRFIKITQSQYEMFEESPLFNGATCDYHEHYCIVYVNKNNQNFMLKTEFTLNSFYATKNVMETL